MSSARAARSVSQVWLGDKSAWPVIATCVLASGLATAHILRMSTKGPDVAWTKEKRGDLFRYKADEGADWSSHRRKIAVMHKNVINEAKGLNN